MALRENGEVEFTSEHLPMMVATGTRWLLFRDIPDLLKKFANGSITLDYGCGVGASTMFLRSCNLNVMGVDISADAIARAKELDPAGNYEVIESAKIPKANNYFDIISSTMVLPYISNIVEIKKVLKEFYRCLKIGGIAILGVNNENTFRYKWLSIDCSFKENLPLRSGGFTKAVFKDSGVTLLGYFWTDRDYIDAIVDAGLQVIYVHHARGEVTDQFSWTFENRIPPFTLYVVQKSELMQNGN